MKNSEAYLKAAEIVFRHSKDNISHAVGACYGIQSAFRWQYDDDAVYNFARWFKPVSKDASEFWWTNPTIDPCVNERVLALLLMHEIAKDEEKRK